MRPGSRIDFRLYLITDRKIVTDLETACEEALKGGVKAIQLREKDLPVRELLAMAKRLRALTKMYSAKLFISDRVDVALASGADGVHLGGTSIPPQAVRIAGEKLLIGVSTHSLEEAEEAERAGADFITLGPVFETVSKIKFGKPIGTGILKEAAQKLHIPVFALGGIKLTNMAQALEALEALEAGCSGIALISAIFGAPEIKTETEKFIKRLNQ